jgi:hypothetical protein
VAGDLKLERLSVIIISLRFLSFILNFSFFYNSAFAGLLDIVEKKKPYGGNMWDDVAFEYNHNRPANFMAREADTLRRKYYGMKNSKKPTGKCVFHFFGL